MTMKSSNIGRYAKKRKSINANDKFNYVTCSKQNLDSFTLERSDMMFLCDSKLYCHEKEMKKLDGSDCLNIIVVGPLAVEEADRNSFLDQ